MDERYEQTERHKMCLESNICMHALSTCLRLCISNVAS